MPKENVPQVSRRGAKPERPAPAKIARRFRVSTAYRPRPETAPAHHPKAMRVPIPWCEASLDFRFPQSFLFAAVNRPIATSPECLPHGMPCAAAAIHAPKDWHTEIRGRCVHGFASEAKRRRVGWFRGYALPTQHPRREVLRLAMSAGAICLPGVRGFPARFAAWCKSNPADGRSARHGYCPRAAPKRFRNPDTSRREHRTNGAFPPNRRAR